LGKIGEKSRTHKTIIQQTYLWPFHSNAVNIAYGYNNEYRVKFKILILLIELKIVKNYIGERARQYQV